MLMKAEDTGTAGAGLIGVAQPPAGAAGKGSPG